MWIDFMQAGFQEMPDRTAVVWNDREYTYGWFSEAIPRWIERIRADGVAAGDVVALRGDFSPGTVGVAACPDRGRRHRDASGRVGHVGHVGRRAIGDRARAGDLRHRRAG